MAPYEKAEALWNHESPIAILHAIVNLRVFPLFLETALMTIYTIQTVYFIYHRCSVQGTKAQWSRHRNRHVNSMLCLSICLYFLTVAYWVLDIISARQELLVLLPTQLSSTPNPDVYGIVTEMLGVRWYVQNILQILIWTSSDGIVLWRAYTVLGRVRWLKITTIVVICIEIGVYLNYIVFFLYVLPTPPSFIRQSRHRDLIIVAPYLATASTTLAVQIFATILIAWKAWTVWKSRKGLFDGPGRAFRALAVLIESGIVYTMLWIWYSIALNANIVGLNLAVWTDYYLMPLTAMYPTLVVMVVTLQDSVLANTPERILSTPIIPSPADEIKEDSEYEEHQVAP